MAKAFGDLSWYNQKLRELLRIYYFPLLLLQPDAYDASEVEREGERTV